MLAEDTANKIAGDFEKRGAPIPPVVSGPEGLRIAKAYYPDPRRLEPIKKLYLLFLSSDGKEIVVLACDPESGKKIFEDAVCTPKIDLRAWESAEAASCMPTLDTRKICRQ